MQEALADEQAVALGRGRSEPRGEGQGPRNGYDRGRLRTAEGGLRVKLPQSRGRAEPSRSQLWPQVASTSAVRKQLSVEMDGGAVAAGP